ncbi:hypothetical protein PWT90_07659 [Aphanocladium album]|nr:hypothetical protein PWT90_07659 [Aphanocladium album]
MASSPIPPLPPGPAPPARKLGKAPSIQPSPPVVEENGPSEAFILELIIANGYPFKDHWSYFIRSHRHPDVGTVIHATGEVANGFRFDIKRCFDLGEEGNRPSKRILLQWLEGKYVNEERMLNGGVFKFDTAPVCPFEESVHKIKVPEKTLTTVGGDSPAVKKITQRNCQTWIIESADQLVRDGILLPDVAAYLRAIEQ